MGTAALGGSVLAGTSVAGLSTGAMIGSALIGGAVGSAVGQLAGMAMGVVDEFSWRQVAVGGLGAALTAGAGNIGLFGSVGQSASWSQVATTYARNAAVSYSVNQLSSRVAGLDTSFSWRGVAASVAGAVAGGAANRGLGLTGTDMWSGIARSFIAGSTHGYFNQQWARGGKIDFVQLAMDSFGNAIGNDIVDKLTPKAAAPDARALKALQSQANMTESERAQVVASMPEVKGNCATAP